MSSKITITPWQKYQSEIVNLSQKITDGKEAFTHKSIPLQDDPRWETWLPDSDGKYGFDESSTLESGKQLRFTYMQTILNVPAGYTLDSVDVSFSHVDDGARIFVFNDDNPAGQSDPNEVINGNNIKSTDLKNWIKVGGSNRIVVVQFDWARVKNTLKNLQIEVDGEPIPAPVLGSLRVISYNPDTSPGVEPPIQLLDMPSVELILDASGSMEEQKMMVDGVEKTRMKVATDVLQKVIDEDLSAEMDVALRVFGPSNLTGEKITVNGNSNTGYTTLHQPLARLDKQGLKNKVAAISAGGYTPIAGSLEEVPKDLASAQGSKLVVLLTDGNENCGGDFAATIETLIASGFDVVINIVGFAISDPNLDKKFEEAAKKGRGVYVKAENATELRISMFKAMSVPYWVKKPGVRGRVGLGYVDGPAIELSTYDNYTVTLDPTDPDYAFDILHQPVSANTPTEIVVKRW